VQSALNEPFKAEIPVTALQPGEKENLEIRLAPQKEFDKAGLYRSFILSDLSFDVVTKNGQTLVVLTTNKAVKEPFLDFLITATSGTGLMVREYTVLLDPPAYVTSAFSSSDDASTETTEEVSSTSTSNQPKTTQYNYATETSASVTSYKVKKNDTLWNVAQATKPSDDISVHQMMMALYDENPNAFYRENVNGLKAGSTLSVPSQAVITARTRSEAIAEFNAQNEAWKNRNKVAVEQDVTPAPVNLEKISEAKSDDANTSESNVSDTTQTSALSETIAETESRLNLVAPDEGSSIDAASPNTQGDENLSALSEQLTLAQETIEAQAQENIDLKARLDLMEEQLETLQRLISVEDPELAQLQDLLTEQQAEVDAMAAEIAAAGAEGVTATTAEEELETEEVPSTQITEEPSKAEPSEPVSGDDSDNESLTNESLTVVDDVVAEAANLLNMDEQEVASTVEEAKTFIADNKIPVVGGLLLLLVLLLLIIRRNKSERTWDDAVQEMDGEDEGQSIPIVGAVVEDEEEEIEELVEEKSVAELVEQADMFIGYADYVQAKNALDQARDIDDEDTMVAHKLLFVLYKQEQTDAFISLVEESNFDKDSFEWTEISKWGSELAPQHTLFAAPVITSQPEPVEEVVEEPVTKTTAESAVEMESAELEPIEAVVPVQTVPEVEEIQETGPIDFDINATATSEVDEAEAIEPSDKDDADDDLLAFDIGTTSTSTVDVEDDVSAPEVLDLDTSIASPELEPVELNAQVEEEDLPTLDLDSATDDDLSLDDEDVAALELDVDDTADMDFEIEDLDDIDEAETKLDLASAYIEMGDPEGARSILNEVLVEGNDEQKKRAETLLENLA
jgi:pilus assembly protein FimV